MKTIAEIHTDHLEVVSDINFLKKELEFLLKILSNCYSVSINNDKIKLLDGYWKCFESNINKLELLERNINNEEKAFAELFKNNLIGSNTKLKDDSIVVADFYRINREVKIFKESFYEYMNGCCACSFKKN